MQLEDLVSRAALRLLTVDVVGRIACKSVSGSADAGPSRDAVARSYLRRILANLLVDEWRKAQRRREVPLDDDSGTRAAGAGAVPRPPPGGGQYGAEPATPESLLMERNHAAVALEAISMLKEAFAAAVQSRQERYRAELERAWDEVWALRDDSGRVSQLIEGRMTEEERGTERGRVRARNRMYAAHKRLREALLETSRQAELDGRINPEQARLLERSVTALLRCQRSADRASSCSGKSGAQTR